MPRPPTVFGKEVTEFALLMRQGEQAWLLTSEGHTEFSRCFWMKDQRGDVGYRIRDNFGRVGKSDCVGCAIDETGCTISWSCGRKTHLASGWYQLTWR